MIRVPLKWWRYGMGVALLSVAFGYHVQSGNYALPGPDSYASDPSDLGAQSRVDFGSESLTQSHAESRARSTVASIFSANFPASDRLKQELRYVRERGRLQRENEDLIERAITAASHRFKMPPSILWCLLFQESRLNHLAGISDSAGALGLGQFSSFSFYEINHQLDRYYKGTSLAWVELLGRDVRPVAPKHDNVTDPSSYFYIPTAVISSATFLNNRYHHLGKLLGRHRVTYDPQLLWLHAALAYNKGSRSVLALWKETRRARREKASLLFTDRHVFLSSVAGGGPLKRALQRIWSPAKADAYSKEASRHLEIIGECSLTPGKSP